MPSSFVPVSSLTLTTSFPRANITSAKRSSSFSSISKIASSLTYHLHHVPTLLHRGAHHPALPLILLTQTSPILSYSALTTIAHPLVGGSSSERTRNASCAAARRTNRSVGYPPLRQRAIPFHVAKHRLIPLYSTETLSFFALHRLLLPFLMGSDSFNCSESETTPQSSAPLSPVAEWPASNPSSPTSSSLNRSRTLPSQRSGADDDRHRSRLLRKQRPQTHRPEGLYPGANVSA